MSDRTTPTLIDVSSTKNSLECAVNDNVTRIEETLYSLEKEIDLHFGLIDHSTETDTIQLIEIINKSLSVFVRQAEEMYNIFANEMPNNNSVAQRKKCYGIIKSLISRIRKILQKTNFSDNLLSKSYKLLENVEKILEAEQASDTDLNIAEGQPVYLRNLKGFTAFQIFEGDDADGNVEKSVSLTELSGKFLSRTNGIIKIAGEDGYIYVFYEELFNRNIYSEARVIKKGEFILNQFQEMNIWQFFYNHQKGLETNIVQNTEVFSNRENYEYLREKTAQYLNAFIIVNGKYITIGQGTIYNLYLEIETVVDPAKRNILRGIMQLLQNIYEELMPENAYDSDEDEIVFEWNQAIYHIGNTVQIEGTGLKGKYFVRGFAPSARYMVCDNLDWTEGQHPAFKTTSLPVETIRQAKVIANAWAGEA